MTKEERMAIIAEIESLVGDPDADQVRLQELRKKIGAKHDGRINNGKDKGAVKVKLLEEKELLRTTDIPVEDVARKTGTKIGTLRTYLSKGMIVREVQG